ncbi:hypothetical protein ACWERY_02255 [Streptomyces sp. NPDC004082]
MIRRFLLHTATGHAYEGVEFSSGQICINHPDDPNQPGRSFSVYLDMAHPLRTSSLYRGGRVEYLDDQEQP